MLLVSAVLAQGGYDLSWFTVDGGGSRMGNPGYTLNGTAGQPDASAALTGGGYTLVGGFWSGAGVATAPGDDHFVYLPLVLKNH